ncbi:glycoside hydrolase family 35 protein [Paenibacillus eucommiae]|uniref:Beta-galactosidase n=1 Tax=Paenibacillus eucommiae TaxID=1355755 RepID=A0ABS4IU00_9BACL|nr:beta-galactosidase [Paenibacillus eucommiae]MBP1991050.1 beta-galactosidase [Paenibacillus eucommiae]
MAVFQIKNEQFMMDDKPVRLLSGAMHYFRIVPEYWKDRLIKLKACGFNTVETYVAWNVHEPVEGQFHFAGMADLVRFIEIAAELQLHVIVRPSPYICAEWDFGGLPAWLLADPGMRLRCYHEPFLEKVDRYYDVLIPMLKPLLCTHGGPIIAVQIENEYGSYGNDTRYLEYIKQALIVRGVDVPLFTSDGPVDFLLQGGMVPGVLETVNFGTEPQEAFTNLQKVQSGQPLMCTEFWNGNFDHWGEEHHTRDAGEIAQLLDEMLQLGASVNIYMFHGGTNFGFYNGANLAESYTPTITSYDYDAPLNEAGDLTEKYAAMRDVLAKYGRTEVIALPDPIKKMAYGSVAMDQRAALFSSLDQLTAPAYRTNPEPMEMLGQSYGFILYTTRVSGPREENELILQDVHDRALIFVDGVYQGVIDRAGKEGEGKLKLRFPQEGAELSILVENMGRTNFGPYLLDRKGITEGVRLGNQYLFGWTIHTLPMQDLTRLAFEQVTSNKEADDSSPAFYKGTLLVDELADTFLELKGWTKGVVFVNGFNLGRYWHIGPQRTLYVPAPLLREGENEIIVFELHGTNEAVVNFRDYADLG